MGYLSIPLDEAARKLLTIVFPFGHFECLVLPQGVKPAKDIFQVRMVGIFASMHMNRPCPYLDDIFHYKRETFDECLQILDEICVIGIINFIKNHIPMCAALVRQLTELTRKDTKFKWDKQKQKEFDKLKASVANSIRITYPDPTKPFIYCLFGVN